MPRDPGETLFEAVAGTVIERYQRVWKAGTLRVNQAYLRQQLLPHFAGRHIADIERRDVRNWFASLIRDHSACGDVPFSMPVLSVIMREVGRVMGFKVAIARAWSERRGVSARPSARKEQCRAALVRRRDTQTGRNGFVCTHARGHREHCSVWAGRLLLLIGMQRRCKKQTLRWSDYREGHRSSTATARLVR